MGKFNYDEETTKQAKEKSEKKKVRSGSDMKLNKGKTYLVILPPTGKDKAAFKEVYHYQFKAGNDFYKVASGSSIDEQDDIQELGFKIYKKYSDKEKHKKQRDIAKNFMPREEFYVNAVKLKKDPKTKKFSFEEAGSLKLPSGAAKLFMSEIDESGIKATCHPDSGKIMYIQDNGKSGIFIRYDVVKFLEAKPRLIADGLVDMEALEKTTIDLDTKQKEFAQKDIDKLLSVLKKKYKDIVSSLDDEEGEEESVDDDDLEVDDDADDSDSDSELDDEEEKPKKGSKKVVKKTSKKVVEEEEEETDDDDDAEEEEEELELDDDSDDADSDDDDDDDDDNDDDEEEEEKPKSSKKVVKKAASKKK